MKTHFASRALALLLTFVTFFTLFTIGANAASIQDGATTASMTLGHKETILETTAGTMLRACSYQYTTDTGHSGMWIWRASTGMTAFPPMCPTLPC